MKKIVMSLMMEASGWHSGKNGCTTYSLRVIQMIDNMAGLRTNTEIQENRKANKPPNDSKMYEYSAPDLVIKVPSSA